MRAALRCDEVRSHSRKATSNQPFWYGLGGRGLFGPVVVDFWFVFIARTFFLRECHKRVPCRPQEFFSYASGFLYLAAFLRITAFPCSLRISRTGVLGQAV